MKDDVNLFDYNVQDRVNDFVAAAVSQVNGQISSPFIQGIILSDFSVCHSFKLFLYVSLLLHGEALFVI